MGAMLGGGGWGLGRVVVKGCGWWLCLGVWGHGWGLQWLGANALLLGVVVGGYWLWLGAWGLRGLRWVGLGIG